MNMSLFYKRFSFRKCYIKNVKPAHIRDERRDEERAVAGDGPGPTDPPYCSRERGRCCER